MKRDMYLRRKVLQHIESLNAAVYNIDASDLGEEFSGDDQDAVSHKVKIMVGAGFVDATGTVIQEATVVTGLTWEWHEFVEQSRDPQAAFDPESWTVS